MRAAGEEDVLTITLINDPATVAELRELYPRYEQALVSNDVETLMSMFWASPYVARFGPTESLYGISEIEAFRKGRSPVNFERTIKRLDIVAFGNDFASITLAFEREIEGRVTRGRQSQTWVLTPEISVRFQVIASNAILLGSANHFGLFSTQSREIHPG
jgi:hypothetical protein